MRLNPAKCAFSVSSGKFLGFMISQRGIEANPEKMKAIIDMETPKTPKTLQLQGYRQVCAVLQSFERGQTSYRMDSRMQPGISKLEELHEPGTVIIKTTPRRSPPPIPLGIQYCRQLSIDTEAREGRATDFLCQQGSPERGASVPTLRAASTGPGRLGAKASPILPGARDYCPDKPAPSASTPKARNVGPIGQMGNRVGRI
ncbi:unnamed protein product [Prunus armeniaca]